MSTHSPVKVTCVCGQRFAAKDSLAGKTVKCPKCRAPLRIPQQTAGPCPSCRAEMPAGAVLCIQCGYSHQLGRRVESELDKTEKTPTDESWADRPSPRSGKKKHLWILAAVVGVVILFGIAWAIAQQPRASLLVYIPVSIFSVPSAGMYLRIPGLGAHRRYRWNLLHGLTYFICPPGTPMKQEGLFRRCLLNWLLAGCSAVILLVNAFVAFGAIYAFQPGDTREVDVSLYLLGGVVLFFGGHAVGIIGLVQYSRGRYSC